MAIFLLLPPLSPLFPWIGQPDPSWWDLLTVPILNAVEQLANHVHYLVNIPRNSATPLEGALFLLWEGWPFAFSAATVGYAIYIIGKKTIVSFSWPHYYYGYGRTPSGEVRLQPEGRPFGEAFIIRVTTTRFPPSLEGMGGATSLRGEAFSLHLGLGVDLDRFLLVYYPPQPPSPDDWDEWKYVYFPSPHGYTRFPRFIYNFLTGRQDPDVFRPSFPSAQEVFLALLGELEGPLLSVLLLLLLLTLVGGPLRRLGFFYRLFS